VLSTRLARLEISPPKIIDADDTLTSPLQAGLLQLTQVTTLTMLKLVGNVFEIFECKVRTRRRHRPTYTMSTHINIEYICGTMDAHVSISDAVTCCILS
jgi:hypothetical protein